MIEKFNNGRTHGLLIFLLIADGKPHKEIPDQEHHLGANVDAMKESANTANVVHGLATRCLCRLYDYGGNERSAEDRKVNPEGASNPQPRPRNYVPQL
jgi:hypothetical protein